MTSSSQIKENTTYKRNEERIQACEINKKLLQQRKQREDNPLRNHKPL